MRRILEFILPNCTLVDAILCPTMRKPFDVLAEGPILKKWRRRESNPPPL
jgi:hypothetical protein